jgi:hypothetical protein
MTALRTKEASIPFTAPSPFTSQRLNTLITNGTEAGFTPTGLPVAETPKMPIMGNDSEPGDTVLATLTGIVATVPSVMVNRVTTLEAERPTVRHVQGSTGAVGAAPPQYVDAPRIAAEVVGVPSVTPAGRLKLH